MADFNTIGLNGIVPVNIPIQKPCKGYYLRWYYNGWHYWFFLPGETNMKTEGENYRTIGTRKIAMGSGQVDYSQMQAIRTILNTREVYILTTDGWKNIHVDTGSVITYKNHINGYEIEITTTIGSKEISKDTGYTPIPIIPIVEPPPYDYCEINIGTQIWMCANWDSMFPQIRYPDDDIDNKADYGMLYKYSQITSTGFVPSGWHVPTSAEMNTLINFVGSTVDAGGILKAIGTTYWNTPNTGAVNTYSFDARGAGYHVRNRITNASIGFNILGFFWAIEGTTGRLYVMKHNSAGIITYDEADFDPAFYAITDIYASVRLIKDGDPIFDDWFLPSENELIAMYDNLHSEGVGGFTTNDYWSSTELSAPFATAIKFTTGATNGTFKDTSDNVRACRIFTATEGLYALRDVGPAGGLIFYINGAGTTYYEAAPSDQSTGYVWSGAADTEIGTTSADIGEGQNNTNEIIAQPDLGVSAARLCDDLEIVN